MATTSAVSKYFGARCGNGMLAETKMEGISGVLPTDSRLWYRVASPHGRFGPGGRDGSGARHRSGGRQPVVAYAPTRAASTPSSMQAEAGCLSRAPTRLSARHAKSVRYKG